MVKLTTDKQTDRQTDKQTGKKQYVPDHSIRGHNKRHLLRFCHNKDPLHLKNKVKCEQPLDVVTIQTLNIALYTVCR